MTIVREGSNYFAMRFRRSLFQLEQWSPGLARKLWGVSQFRNNPAALAMGIKLLHLEDDRIKVQIPSKWWFNRDEQGDFHPTAVLTAGEYACRIIWSRHIDDRLEEMDLQSCSADFVQKPQGNLIVTKSLAENEKEEVLRALRRGEAVEHSSAVLVIDEKKQQIAVVNFKWKFRPLRPLAITGG